MTQRPVRYAIALLGSALAFGIAGLNHPFLHGDASAQLATIAATAHWRLIHWTLAFAFPLMLWPRAIRLPLPRKQIPFLSLRGSIFR